MLDFLFSPKQGRGKTSGTPTRKGQLSYSLSSLAEVIADYYTNDKQSGWTDKAKLEYRGYFELCQTACLLADSEISMAPARASKFAVIREFALVIN